MSSGMSKALGMLRRVERSRLCPAARTVLAKEGEGEGSSAQCLQKWDYSALVSSDVPSSCGGRKRVSKEERRDLVEAYVNEYRKRNNGKFPSATDAKKHAGGCFYFVRKIVQELEYVSRFPPSTSRTVMTVETEQIDEKKSLTGGNKFQRRVSSDIDRENSSQKVDKHIKRVKENMKDTSVNSWTLGDRKEKAEYFHGTDFNQLHTKKAEQHEAHKDVDAKDDLRKQTDKLVLDGKDDVVKHIHQKEDFTCSVDATLEAKEHPSQPPSEPEESAKRKDDAEHFGAKSFWDNLKTFADGFISIWRQK